MIKTMVILLCTGHGLTNFATTSSPPEQPLEAKTIIAVATDALLFQGVYLPLTAAGNELRFDGTVNMGASTSYKGSFDRSSGALVVREVTTWENSATPPLTMDLLYSCKPPDSAPPDVSANSQQQDRNPQQAPLANHRRAEGGPAD
jgi:hypothetical protein